MHVYVYYIIHIYSTACRNANKAKLQALDISKIRARAAAVNTARHAKAITIKAQARVEEALKSAGEKQ